MSADEPSTILRWLDARQPPTDIYQFLGRPVLDPDVSLLRATLVRGMRELMPYQMHSDSATAQRAMQLITELGRVEHLLSDADQLTHYQEELHHQLWAEYSASQHAKATSFREWLAIHRDVHPDSLASVISKANAAATSGSSTAPESSREVMPNAPEPTPRAVEHPMPAPASIECEAAMPPSAQPMNPQIVEQADISPLMLPVAIQPKIKVFEPIRIDVSPDKPAVKEPNVANAKTLPFGVRIRSWRINLRRLSLRASRRYRADVQPALRSPTGQAIGLGLIFGTIAVAASLPFLLTSSADTETQEHIEAAAAESITLAAASRDDSDSPIESSLLTSHTRESLSEAPLLLPEVPFSLPAETAKDRFDYRLYSIARLKLSGKDANIPSGLASAIVAPYAFVLDDKGTLHKFDLTSTVAFEVPSTAPSAVVTPNPEIEGTSLVELSVPSIDICQADDLLICLAGERVAMYSVASDPPVLVGSLDLPKGKYCQMLRRGNVLYVAGTEWLVAAAITSPVALEITHTVALKQGATCCCVVGKYLYIATEFPAAGIAAFSIENATEPQLRHWEPRELAAVQLHPVTDSQIFAVSVRQPVGRSSPSPCDLQLMTLTSPTRPVIAQSRQLPPYFSAVHILGADTMRGILLSQSYLHHWDEANLGRLRICKMHQQPALSSF
ncbi:MAG: hypothetical protein KDB11_34280, partial [Planctomycetales bacterium]|nr:hypothetical protein [Planctomycetales bacterium]